MSSSCLLFFALVPFVRDAHRRGDADALRRGYAFAKWCLEQGGDLGNAVGVAFYEHLFDSWDVHAGVLAWLDASVVQECWPLWEPEQLPIGERVAEDLFRPQLGEPHHCAYVVDDIDGARSS